LPADVELFGEIRGQLTADPMLSSEEFGYGGWALGRAYDPSEISGDRGLGLVLELRTRQMDIAPRSLIQPYLFYDIGKVWNIDPGAKNVISGASAGAGFRYEYNNTWNFEGMAAAPLTLAPTNPPQYADEDGVRFLFRVTRAF